MYVGSDRHRKQLASRPRVGVIRRVSGCCTSGMPPPTIPNRDPTIDKPPRPRRWVPASPRIFLAILAVLGVAGAWLSVNGYRQAAAIREIERLNGRVLANSDGGRHLAHLVGDRWRHAFDDVEGIALGHTQFSDSEAYHLDALSNVSALSLCYTRISDATVVHVSKMSNVTDLDLSGTGITDAGLTHLSRISKLKRLNLTNTRVTNLGLAGFRYSRPDVVVMPGWKADGS
jgi:hypothetical protein